MASFEIFGYLAKRLTACACSLLIGAHGAHSIGRIYMCKGYYKGYALGHPLDGRWSRIEGMCP